MKIIVNGVDITSKVANQTLSINIEIDNCDASFSVFLEKDTLELVQLGMEILINNDEGDRVFGGIIGKLDGNYIVGPEKKVTEIGIQCDSYNRLTNRFNVTTLIESSGDGTGEANTCGEKAWWLIDRFLGSEGIERGVVQPGPLIDDTDLDGDFYLEKLTKILDSLADSAGLFVWNIDHLKRFNFYSGNLPTVTHINESFRLMEGNKNFREVSFTQDLADYNNRFYIIGGYPDEDVPDENMTEDGKLMIRKQYLAEKNKMIGFNGGSAEEWSSGGSWADIYKNEKITTMAEARRFADELLEEFGETPAKVEFKTNTHLFNVGDFFPVDLPMFIVKGGQRIFTIDDLNIEDRGAGNMEYSYNASMRSTNRPTENFVKFLERRNEASVVATVKPEPEIDNDFGLPKGMLLFFDFDDISRMELDPDNPDGIRSITDISGNNVVATQNDSNHQPMLMRGASFNYADFSAGSNYWEKSLSLPVNYGTIGHTFHIIRTSFAEGDEFSIHTNGITYDKDNFDSIGREFVHDNNSKVVVTIVYNRILSQTEEIYVSSFLRDWYRVKYE